KRASASRTSGQWKEDDYDVLADGVVVGRIYGDASASTPPELRCFWSILEVIPDIKTHGHAATREAAMAAVANRWWRECGQSPLSGGGFNRSAQHLLILRGEGGVPW